MMVLPEGQSWVFEMVNNILIEVMGIIAEQERQTIKQRQAEVIAAAKANGMIFGRPAMKTPENGETISNVNNVLFEKILLNQLWISSNASQ